MLTQKDMDVDTGASALWGSQSFISCNQERDLGAKTKARQDQPHLHLPVEPELL